jgi:putative redox protein
MAVEIQLVQSGGPYRFECVNAAGKSCVIDGPSSIGGGEDGLRPMELVLMGLAGCSTFDIINILRKQRQNVVDLKVKVIGERAEVEPKVYTEITLQFVAVGEVDPVKLQRAVELSMDKYCSVAAMLNKTAVIRYESSVLPAE